MAKKLGEKIGIVAQRAEPCYLRPKPGDKNMRRRMRPVHAPTKSPKMTRDEMLRYSSSKTHRECPLSTFQKRWDSNKVEGLTDRQLR